METKPRTLEEVGPLFACALVMAMYVLGAGSLLHQALAVAALFTR